MTDPKLEEQAQEDITESEPTNSTEEQSDAISEGGDTGESTEPETPLDEIEKLKLEAETNLDGWQRSRAEFANYKRRTNQELADAHQRGATDALAKMLPMIDDFERALDNIPDDINDHSWVDGTDVLWA